MQFFTSTKQSVTRSIRARTVTVVGIVLAGVLLGACSSGTTTTPTASTPTTAPTSTAMPGTATSIDVVLNEFNIIPATESAPAGSITFVAKNEGAIAHELVVVRSDAEATALPMLADGSKVDENAIDVIDEIEEFAAGGEESKTFELSAGRYLLICNIAAHYGAGMVTEFTVN